MKSRPMPCMPSSTTLSTELCVSPALTNSNNALTSGSVSSSETKPKAPAPRAGAPAATDLTISLTTRDFSEPRGLNSSPEYMFWSMTNNPEVPEQEPAPEPEATTHEPEATQEPDLEPGVHGIEPDAPDDPESPEWWTSYVIPLPDDVAAACDAARKVGRARKTKFSFEEWDRIGIAVVAARRLADELIEAGSGNRNTFQKILEQERIAGLIAAPNQENYLYATCTRLLAQQARKAEILTWREELTEAQRAAWQSPRSIENHCPIFGGTFVKYGPNTANLSDPSQVTGGDGQRYDDLTGSRGGRRRTRTHDRRTMTKTTDLPFDGVTELIIICLTKIYRKCRWTI